MVMLYHVGPRGCGLCPGHPASVPGASRHGLPGAAAGRGAPGQVHQHAPQQPQRLPARLHPGRVRLVRQEVHTAGAGRSRQAVAGAVPDDDAPGIRTRHACAGGNGDTGEWWG